MSYLINQITESFLNQQITKSLVGTGPGYALATDSDYIVAPGVVPNNADMSIYVEFSLKSDQSGIITFAGRAVSSQLLFRHHGPNGDFDLLYGSGTLVSIPYPRFKAGKHAVMMTADVNGFWSVYVNGKLIGSLDISGITKSITNFTTEIGKGSGTDDPVFHKFKIFNRVLTPSEVEQVSRGQYLGFADYGASGAASYTSDFSVNANGFVVSQNVTVAGNQDAVSGEDNVLTITANTASGSHDAQKLNAFTPGKRYRVKIKYLIPSGQSNCDGIELAAGNLSIKTLSQVGSWTTEIFEFNNTATVVPDRLYCIMLDGGIASFADAGGDDVIHIKEIVITPIGLVLDLNEWGMSPTQWFDHSGNSYNGAVNGATRINPISLAADKHVSLTNLPTSASGLAAGRVWNDAGTLKIVT